MRETQAVSRIFCFCEMSILVDPSFYEIYIVYLYWILFGGLTRFNNDCYKHLLVYETGTCSIAESND